MSQRKRPSFVSNRSVKRVKNRDDLNEVEDFCSWLCNQIQSCEVCGHTTLDVVNHILNYHSNSIISCSECKQKLLVSKLKEHVAIDHPIPLFQCKVCKKELYSYCEFVNHETSFNCSTNEKATDMRNKEILTEINSINLQNENLKKKTDIENYFIKIEKSNEDTQNYSDNNLNMKIESNNGNVEIKDEMEINENINEFEEQLPNSNFPESNNKISFSTKKIENNTHKIPYSTKMPIDWENVLFGCAYCGNLRS